MSPKKILATTIFILSLVILVPVIERTLFGIDPFIKEILTFVITGILFVALFFDKSNYKKYQYPVAISFVGILAFYFLPYNKIQVILISLFSLSMFSFYVLRFISKQDKDGFDYLKLIVVAYFSLGMFILHSELIPIDPRIGVH